MRDTLATRWAAIVAILQRDFVVFVTYRWQLVAQMAGVVFSVTLFYYVSRLVRVGPLDPADYFGFVVVGLVIVQVLQSTLGVPLQVRSELVAGTFERVIMSPFGAVGSILAMMVFPFISAVILSTVMLMFAVVVFDMPIDAATAPLAIPVALLGTLSFAAFGMLFAAMTLAFKQATGIQWLIAGISLIGGLYFPVALLPDWIRWLSEVQPFTPTVDLLRHLLSGQPTQDPALVSLAKIVGFGAVLLPISMAAVAAAGRMARRRGTIIEY
jgi:ABC-2 type transport system permease protein